jgi:hypothetical protein
VESNASKARAAIYLENDMLYQQINDLEVLNGGLVIIDLKLSKNTESKTLQGIQPSEWPISH